MKIFKYSNNLTLLLWTSLLTLIVYYFIYFSRDRQLIEKTEQETIRKFVDVMVDSKKKFRLINFQKQKNQFLKTEKLNPSEASWQIVENLTDSKFLVFSAFLDVRFNPTIMIIAVTKTEKRLTPKFQVWCKLWYMKQHKAASINTIEGHMKIIQEHWDLPYSAYYIICPLTENQPVPDAISLLNTPNAIPHNYLKVIVNLADQWDPTRFSGKIDKIAVCVKPLHYEYNRVFELLEFIELHRILGISHFFFYNHTVGAKVDCLLRKYQVAEIISVLPWQLPLESQKEIRTEGIFASLNDCLFRTMHKYSHVAYVDLDEFIIPTKNYSYRDMFDFLEKKHDIKEKSTFSFKNAFFYRQWPDDPEVKSFNDPIAEKLIVLSKTTRKIHLHPHGQRSKFIIRPEFVNMVGNHFVWEYYNRRYYGSIDVDPTDAYLHHYRVCEFGGDDCVTQESTVDKTVYRYRSELIAAVRFRYQQHLDYCNLGKAMEV